MDLFSRRIVGWHMSSRMTSDTVCMALNMAIGLRNPEKGLVVHSDRGSQYASQKYQSLLSNHSFIGSMSRKGDCWDNSVAESFFHSMKVELIHDERYATRAFAKESIFEYIEIYYNRLRRHSSIGSMAPEAFEHQFKKVA